MTKRGRGASSSRFANVIVVFAVFAVYAYISSHTRLKEAQWHITDPRSPPLPSASQVVFPEHSIWPEDSEADSGLTAAPPLLWSSQQLGVFHYRLPGLVGKAHDATVLHLLLKAVSSNSSGIEVWGLGYAEFVQGNKWPQTLDRHKYPHLSQTKALGRSWRPRIYLKLDLGDHEEVINFTAYHHLLNGTRADPFHISLMLSPTAAAAAACVEIHVDHWLAYADVSIDHWTSHLKAGSFLNRHQPVQAGKQAIFVLAPVHSLSPLVLATLLLHSLRYHVRLGFTSFCMYVRPSLASGLLALQDIVAAVQQRKLVLVLWEEDFASYRLLPYAEQSLIYSHAILTHHNYNAFLFIADIDEFLVSFAPMPPAGLLTTMGAMIGENGSAARLGRLPVICGNCYQPEDEAKASTATSRELALWLSDASQRPGHHPLLHYTAMRRRTGLGQKKVASHWERPDYGKSIVRPQAVIAYGVHWGYATLNQSSRSNKFWGINGTMVPTPPLAVLHLWQLLSDRSGFRPWAEGGPWENRTD